MTEKTLQTVLFYGYTIYIEDCFTYTVDENKKILMVLEKDYTDFNAVLAYLDDTKAIHIYPRWQTNFIVAENAITIIRERPEEF